MKFLVPCILVTLIFIIFFIKNITSLPEKFTNPLTCWDIFVNCDNQNTNDAPFNCNGTDPQHYCYVGKGGGPKINQTYFLPDSGINITCDFWQPNGANGTMYVWYYNGSDWYTIYENTRYETVSTGFQNVSISFKLNSSTGEHRIRCAITCEVGTSVNPDNGDFCLNVTEAPNKYYDNDDVNFTVTDYPKYDSWNLTNYTSATTIPDGANVTRNDKINASAYWNKDLSTALIQHNGTGYFQNYTFSISGNWTNYTLDLSNSTDFNTTGLIEVSYIWANDTYGLDNTTSPSHYFYLWGNSKLGQIYLNSSTIYNNTAAQIFCKVLDSDLNYSISGYNVTFYDNSTGYLGNSLTNNTGWANLSYTFTTSSFPGHLNLSCNITDSENLYYNETSQNSNSTMLTVENPGEVLIGDFWFEYLGTATNKTNLNTTLVIKANISDNVQMESVTANLTYPQNIINVNLSMTGNTSAGWHVWNYSFNETYPLNMTGNYTVGIISKNSNGVQNISTYYMTFYVNDTYTLNLTSDYTLFMRGENVTIQALDVNDNVVENVSWNVNVTKFFNDTLNVTDNYSSLATIFNYTIRLDDPEVNHTIWTINATKYGNYGNNTWNFNVNRNFSISYDPSPLSITRGIVISFISITLKNVRGDTHTSPVSANISCHNSSYVYKTFPLTFTNGIVNNFINCSAPSSDGSYNITMNVTDDYNNTGYEVIFYQLITTTTSTVPPGGGGGGGTRTEPAPTENCTDGIDNDGDDLIDCNDTDCSEHIACQKVAKIPNFNFNVTPVEIEIIRGENGTIVGSMANTGDVQLLLTSSVTIEKDCCVVDTNKSFLLPQQTKTATFPVIIHVNTSTQPGEYIVTLKISYYNLQNSQGIRVIVKENPTINNILVNTPSQLNELISRISEYKSVGLEVSYLESLITKIQKAVQDSRTAVQEDNLDQLKQYENTISFDMEQINAELDRLFLQKIIYENKYNIVAGISIGVILTYLIVRVIVPFIRITTEITQLTFKEASLIKSRKATEKQYFMRTIDEPTFRKIVTDVHAKVMNLTSTIKMKKEQRVNLLKKRLNPLSLGEYIKSKTKEKKKE